LRLTKLIFGSLAVLAILAVLLATALSFLDLSLFRAQLESRATIALDRRVAFAGSIELEPSLHPRIVVEDVHIANPAWASRSDFAHVQRLEIRVALLPLLQGELTVLDVIMKGADVLLEVGADDSDNFTFRRREGPLQLPDIRKLKAQDATLGFRDADEKLHNCTVEEAEARITPGQPVSLTGQLTCQDVPLQLSLSAGTPDAFASGATPWPIALEANTGDASLVAEGNIPHSRIWDGAMFQISVQGEKVDSIEDLFDVSLAVRQPFDLSAELRTSAKTYFFSNLEGTIGATDIGGELEWNQTGERPRLGGRLASNSMHIQELLTPPEPNDQTQPDPLDRPLLLEWLTAIDARLELVVQRVEDSPVPIRNAAVTTTLNSGELVLSPWRATLFETPITGQFVLAEAEGAAKINLTAEAEQLDLGHMLRELGSSSPVQADIQNLALSLNSQGNTLRTLLRDAKVNVETGQADIRSEADNTRLPWIFEITQAELAATEAQPTRVSVEGTFRGAPLTLLAETVTLEELASMTESWPLSLEAHSSDAKLAGDGAIIRNTVGATLELQATLEGERAASLDQLLAASLPDSGPYRFSAGLDIAENAFAISGIEGNIGSTDIAGELQWTQTGERPLLAGKLVSQSMHIQDLLTAPERRSPGEAHADILDQPVRLDWLVANDAELELQARRVAGSAIPIRDVFTTARLISGQLTLSPMRGTLAGTLVTGDLNLTWAKDGAAIEVKARANRLDLSKLLEQLETESSLQGGADDVRLAMSSRGRTFRDLLQHAKLSIETQQGRISSGDISGKPWVLDITTAAINATENRQIKLTVDGKHRGNPFELSANTITLEGLATKARAWPLEVSLQALEGRLHASGHVADPLRGSGFDLAVEITGKDPRELDPVLHYVIPLQGEYRISGHFRDHGNSYSLSDIHVQVGESDIGGSIDLVMEEPRPKINASLRSRMIHYDDLALAESPNSSDDETRVIPEYVLPVEALLAVNLDVDLEAERIRMRGGDLGNLVLKATLDNGRSVWSARVTNNRMGGRLEVHHKVNVNADPPLHDLRLTARDLDYGLILTNAEVASIAEGRVNVDIALAGPGATNRSFLGHADGQVTIVGGSGRIASREYRLWSSDLVLTMLTAGWRREAVTEINCIIGHIDIQGGIAKTDKLLLDTTRLTIAGSGTFDLDNEELYLLLSPRPKRARLVSVAKPVRVTGNLSSPEVAVTVLPTRRRATRGLLAGLINPALLVVTFSDLGSDGGNACVAATEKLEAAISD